MGKTAKFGSVYGTGVKDAARFEELKVRFAADFPEAGEPELYSAPGRTEIIGNHTDHNGGRILAASITMDTIGAAAADPEGPIVIHSLGYQPIVVHPARLSEVRKGGGSKALLAGILEGLVKQGHKVGGFKACFSTEVIPAAGVSSSASFEMLVVTILDHLYNDGALDYADYARAGQYAENVYWNKASGLMDQMACACGGAIDLDFSDGVKVTPVDFGFDPLGLDLIIVNTGKGHSDLSEAYSSIPGEMRQVAAALGCKNLCETDLVSLLAKLPAIREEIGNDRAILRALHYFEECGRVEEAVEAVTAGDPIRVVEIMNASGNSSWEYLQNNYVETDPATQPIPLAQALSRAYFEKIRRESKEDLTGKLAVRVHGGGFAGVTAAVMPKAYSEGYVEALAPVFGRENIYVMNIRPVGAVKLVQ